MADVGVFMNLGPMDRSGRIDPEPDRRKKTLEDGLLQCTGRHHTFDYQHGGGTYGSYLDFAKKLVSGNPDAQIFVAACWSTMDALNKAMQQLSITPPKPVVYVGVTDSKVGVTDPTTWPDPYGDNDTGIKAFEFDDLCPNWPRLLTQIAPDVKRVAVIYDIAGGSSTDWNSLRPCMGDQNQKIIDSATSLGLSVDVPIDPGSPTLKSDIEGFASRHPSQGGLIVTSGTLTAGSRLDITSIATDNNLPVIYASGLFTDSDRHTEGAGLISYGVDALDLYRQAASQFLGPFFIQPPRDPAHIRTDPTDSRFKPVTNKTFDLIVNQTTAQKLIRNGVNLNVTNTMTIILNGVTTPVQVTMVPRPPTKV